MSVQVQQYRTREWPSLELVGQKEQEIRTQHQEEISRLDDLQKRFQELGLDKQVALVGAEKRDLDQRIKARRGISPAMFYPQIVPADFAIWKRWLPTSYWGVKALKNYSFDRIPEEVLREWEMCQALYLFTSYEIRTPESPKAQDPILVGYVFDVPYLIARWAESLRPFEEIRDLILASEEMDRVKNKYTKRIWTAISLMVFGLFGYLFWTKMFVADTSLVTNILVLIIMSVVPTFFIGGILTLLTLTIFEVTGLLPEESGFEFLNRHRLGTASPSS